MATQHTKDTTPARVSHNPVAHAAGMTVDELARHANEAVDKGTAAGLYHVACAGVFLLHAKEKVGHGGWLDWLKVYWKHSPSQATRYMDIASECGRDPNRAIDLKANTVRGALAALGKPVSGMAPNSSRVTNLPKGKPKPKDEATDADFVVLEEKPEPANRVEIKSVEDSPTKAVQEAKDSKPITAPGSMATRLTSGRQPVSAPVVQPGPMIVASCGKWADVTAVLVDAARQFSNMKPPPLPAPDERMTSYTQQAADLAEFVKSWAGVTADCIKDEPMWLAKARKGGAS